ncbi:unnamed protein product [Linum trigynum]|uniref:Uncharacterized protein n=1 Tax=Linum trigynum TaxID=586398 RepID=A0AAV2D6R1_9ROSI
MEQNLKFKQSEWCVVSGATILWRQHREKSRFSHSRSYSRMDIVMLFRYSVSLWALLILVILMLFIVCCVTFNIPRLLVLSFPWEGARQLVLDTFALPMLVVYIREDSC